MTPLSEHVLHPLVPTDWVLCISLLCGVDCCTACTQWGSREQLHISRQPLLDEGRILDDLLLAEYDISRV